jgi:serine/threonine-protein kinase
MELRSDQPVVPVEVGEVVQGKYRIGRIIGFGGMATVAEGHHLELDQPIAIKFLHPEQAARPDAVRRFLSEARAAARLNSPNVARVLDCGTAPTSRGGIVPFMVMELLEGADLDALLMQRGRLPMPEAVEYVLQACAAVAEAHAMGIIHRDLKPGNLFLTVRRDGTPVIKLLDFGISKNLARKGGKNEAAVTADREMMGSPRYMSPEQVRSAKDVDARTDIWSLGVILHELLAGAPPFEDENIADTFVRILHAAPDSLLARAPYLPPDLVEVITRCLQKKRENRYDSVDAFAAALAPYRSATPIVVPPIDPRGDTAELPTQDAGVSVVTVHDLPKRRIALTVAIAFGAVGLVLMAVVGIRKLVTTRPAATANTTATATAPPPAAEDPTALATALATAAPPASAAPDTAEPIELEDGPADPTRPAAPRVKRPAGGALRPNATGTKPAAPPVASGAPRTRTTW